MKTLRQLANALNDAGWKSAKAFYVSVDRYDQRKRNCARIHKGELQVGMCQRDWITVDQTFTFDDGNGNSI